MSNSITAFDNFRNNLSCTNNGDNYLIFKAKIIYSHKGVTEHETLKVTLNLTTYEYGKISIENGQVLTPNKYHLDFNPNFQKYSYYEGGFLIIKGNSSKMSGDYEVKIMSA